MGGRASEWSHSSICCTFSLAAMSQYRYVPGGLCLEVTDKSGGSLRFIQDPCCFGLGLSSQEELAHLKPLESVSIKCIILLMAEKLVHAELCTNISFKSFSLGLILFDVIGDNWPLAKF